MVSRSGNILVVMSFPHIVLYIKPFLRIMKALQSNHSSFSNAYKFAHFKTFYILVKSRLFDFLGILY
jgi:hypothetical protein